MPRLCGCAIGYGRSDSANPDRIGAPPPAAVLSHCLVNGLRLIWRMHLVLRPVTSSASGNQKRICVPLEDPAVDGRALAGHARDNDSHSSVSQRFPYEETHWGRGDGTRSTSSPTTF